MSFTRILFCCSVFSLSGYCEEPPSSPCKAVEEFYETSHEISVGGKTLSYKAAVGSLLLKNEKCESTANLFFTSYTKISDEQRPITFCFNGGPGSSSVWLHIGFAGPKRILFDDSGKFASLPPKMTDNEYSLLDVTDLVFIDPVSTGFSTAVPPDTERKFFSTIEDIASFAKFIQMYLTKFNRWNSPKFLLGESYGTTRASALADRLHDVEFVDLNGIILISTALNYQFFSEDPGNDLPYLLFLPGYTVTAGYYNKLSPDLQKDPEKTIEEVKTFVTSEYASALFRGDLLSSEERSRIAEKLSRYTSLPVDYIQKNNLRIPMRRFAKELLGKSNEVIGRFDSRISGPALDNGADSFSYDPSSDHISGPFAACLNQYLQNDLGVKKDSPYEILSNAIRFWDFNASNQYLNVGDNLSAVLLKNPRLHIFTAGGYYDLATPFFATEYAMNHLGIPDASRTRITLRNYNGGHMMYLEKESLRELKEDLSKFYDKALSEPTRLP